MAMTLLLAATAPATLIVDTGNETGADGGWYVTSSQWIAGQFTLTHDYNITEVQGLIGYTNGVSGDVNAVLRKDSLYQGSAVPGAILYSQEFTANKGLNTWQGPSGLNWAVTAGTYWLAFEPDSLSQVFVGISQNPPNPLSNYAYASSGIYYNSSLHAGMRVYGTQSPVPLPPSVWLFGSGLVGLIGFRRFRRS